MLIRWQFQHIVRDDINIVIQIEKSIYGAHHNAREAETGVQEFSVSIGRVEKMTDDIL